MPSADSDGHRHEATRSDETIVPSTPETAPPGHASTSYRTWIAPLVLLLTALAAVVDPIVALMSRAPYSFADQAISDLGVTSCGPIEAMGGTVEVCSPGWPLMNAAMIITGLALVASAVVVRAVLDAGRGAQFWLVVAGVSTVGAGAVPLDVSEIGHILLALPAFPAQAVALALLAGPVGRSAGRGWRRLVVGAAVVTAVATASFVAPTAWELPFGLLERIAAYLLPLVLAALGVRSLTDARASASP